MAKKAKEKKQAAAKKPRQARLPGTEDAAIDGLNALAEDYAEARDERMEIGKREVALKTSILEVMHKHGRQSYSFDGISVKIKPESEKVVVRIKKEEAESEAAS